MRWAIIVGAMLSCLGCNQGTTVKPPSPVHVQHTDKLATPEETLSSLGLHVRDPDGTPFLTFDREPVNRFVSPYSLDSALPVAVIRKEMTERQIVSLTGAGPHIIRFEVVDLNPKVRPSLYDEET